MRRLQKPSGGATWAWCSIGSVTGWGVRAVPVTEFAGLHSRIYRPVSLTDEHRRRVLAYAIERIGHQYDLRNVIDLARYLFPTPPVPERFRRRMLALGLIPDAWAVGGGKYGTLLGTNLYGLALCTIGFFAPLALPRGRTMDGSRA